MVISFLLLSFEEWLNLYSMLQGHISDVLLHCFSVLIIVDLSLFNAKHIVHIQNTLRHALQEQMCNKGHLNIIGSVVLCSVLLMPFLQVLLVLLITVAMTTMCSERFKDRKFKCDVSRVFVLDVVKRLSCGSRR